MGASAFVLVKFFPKKVTAWLMPDISNVKMDAKQKGDGKMVMNIHADISKSIIPFVLDSVRYKAVLYGDTVTSGHKDFENEKERNLTVPMTLDYKKLLKMMKKHQGDSAVMELFTKSFINVPLLGTKSVDFNKDLKFKMIVFPEVKINKVDIDHFGMNNMDLKVALKVTNPNDIDINIKSMNYNMQIEKYVSSKGEQIKNFHLKANGTSDMVLHMKTDIDKPMKAAWEAIKGKKEWPYEIQSDMVLQPDVKNFDQLNFSTVLTGNLKSGDIKKDKKG